jgi:hypothetical protein
MKVYREVSLGDFDFWAGAWDTIKYLTNDELDQIEQILEELYPEGLSETELNDLFWFEDDLIAEWLGYESFEEILERDDE